MSGRSGSLLHLQGENVYKMNEIKDQLGPIDEENGGTASINKKKKHKKKLSEAKENNFKMNEYDFIGGNINSNFLGSQLTNQQRIAKQQQQNGQFSCQNSNVGGESSLQNFMEWSNHQHLMVTPSKQHNQNSLSYEKDILPSQNFLENQQDMTTIFGSKSFHTFNTPSISQIQSTVPLSKKQATKTQKVTNAAPSKSLSSSSSSTKEKHKNKLLDQIQPQLYQHPQRSFGFENEVFLQKKPANSFGNFLDESNLINSNFNFDFLQYESKQPFNGPRLMNHQGNPSQNSEQEIQCPFNQLQQEIVNSTTYVMPPMNFTEEEPRYVNAAQFKRMMIMRIKRAARDLKHNKNAPPKESCDKSDSEALKMKPYMYESRHKHATNRIRDSKGRFIPKDKLQEYYEQLEKERAEKESQEINQDNNRNASTITHPHLNLNQNILQIGHDHSSAENNDRSTANIFLHIEQDEQKQRILPQSIMNTQENPRYQVNKAEKYEQDVPTTAIIEEYPHYNQMEYYEGQLTQNCTTASVQ